MKFVRKHSFFAAGALLAFVLAASHAAAQFSGAAGGPGSALSIPTAQLIQPEALNQLLTGKSGVKPLVLQVGSHLLFAEAHIPGSKYAGPGSQPAGLEVLASATATQPKNQPIVIYCGCCPWNRCPNLEPAFQKLKDLGFTNVKVLYIADNFGANWVDKGLPVERGR